MVASTLTDRLPGWLAGESPDGAEAVCCQCSLARNLSDFPFPARCTDDEKRAIEARITSVLDGLSLFSTGRYYSLPELSSREVRFLAERRLVTYELMCARGPRGVYVSEDQSLSIMVNGLEHLCLRAIKPGVQLQEAWAQLNLLDDTLRGMLDVAFDDRLGFLTCALNNVGTGLKSSALLHLPALAMANRIAERAELAAAHHLVLRGVRIGGVEERPPRSVSLFDAPLDHVSDEALYTDMEGALGSPVNETQGDLFLLVNRGTLGLSEEELVFQVRQAALDLITLEHEVRAVLLKDSPRALEDQSGRARGIAGGARLLSFSEGLGLLSSLRLGIGTGVLSGFALSRVNELLLASQGAHLEMAKGRKCDPLALSVERADLFRRIVAAS